MLQEDNTVENYENQARLVPTQFKFLKPTSKRTSIISDRGTHRESEYKDKGPMTEEQK